MVESIKKSALSMSKVYTIVVCGVLIALSIALRFLMVPITPDNRISLSFISLVTAGYLLGPVPAAVIGAVADILGYVVNPMGSAYFPGFTLSSMLSGLIYGLCLYRRPMKQLILWIILAKLIITFGVNIVLNTYWLSIMYKKAYAILSGARIIKNFITFPFQVIVSFAVLGVLDKTKINKKFY